MNATFKRLLAALLVLGMIIGLVPAYVFAADAHSTASSEVIEYTEEDYAALDPMWADIYTARDQSTKRGASTEDITDAMVQAVMASDSYVDGSIDVNGQAFTWMTTDGIACIYSPRLDEISKGIDKSDAPSEIEYVSYAKKGGTPNSKSVYLISPYYDTSVKDDSSFTNQYINEAKSIASATGGSYYHYGRYNATISNIATAMQSGAVVIFDSHGLTDSYGTYAGYTDNYGQQVIDYTSDATTSMICLQTGTGITNADYSSGGAYQYQDSDGGYIYGVTGTGIANHMTKQAPNNILWMAICLGMATNGLCGPMRNKGVEVVYGYSQSVTFTGDYKYEATFWDEMIAGKTVASAINTMKTNHGKWDPAYSSYSLSNARKYFVAFPIVASSEDTYPGHGNVDAYQTVNSTWTLYQKDTTCSHSSTSTSTTPATCTTSGKTTVTCNSCGAVVSTTTIPATGHSYSNGVCTVCGASNGSGSTTTDTVYSLVTSPSALTSGEYIMLVVPGGANPGGYGYYAMARQAYNSSYVMAQGADFDSLPSAITYSGSTLCWTLTGNASGFTLSGSDDGAVLYNSSNSLYYKAGTAATWTATQVSGANSFNIKSGTRYLGLRDDITTVDSTNGNPLFRCNSSASSSSYNFYLYKKNASASSCSHSSTSTTVTQAATCTTAGTSAVVCNNCGITISTSTIPATGHSYSNGTCTVCGASDGSSGGSTTEEVFTLVNSGEALTSGRYIILAEASGQYASYPYYAVSTSADSSYYAMQTVGANFDSVPQSITAGSNLVWTVTKSNGNLLIQDASGNYLTDSSSTDGYSLTLGTTGYAWTPAMYTDYSVSLQSEQGYYLSMRDDIEATGANGSPLISIYSSLSTESTTPSGYFFLYKSTGTTDTTCTHSSTSTSTTPATCTTAGSTVVTCNSCGETVSTTTIPATGHTVVTDPAVAATCTTAGKTQGSHCSVCNTVITAQNTVPATGHNFVNGICSVCGESDGTTSSASLYSLVTSPSALTSGEYILIVVPGGANPGNYGYYAMARKAYNSTYVMAQGADFDSLPSVIEYAGTTLVWTLTGNASGFTLTGSDDGSVLYNSSNSLYYKAGTAATWTASQVSGTNSFNILSGSRYLGLRDDLTTVDSTNSNPLFRCNGSAGSSSYNFYLYKKNADATSCDHSSTTNTVTQAATCTTAGVSAVVCNNCGITVSTTTIPATGHTEVTDAAVAATCTTAGKTQGSHCSVCNTVLVAQTTIAATGHVNTTTTTTPATCTTAGKTVETCDDCGKTVSSTNIPATGHVNTTTTTTPATCTAAGKTVETCDDCGATVNTTTIPATGHNYVGGTCTVCGESDGSVTDPETYYLVSDASQITDGEYVLMVAPGKATGYDYYALRQEAYNSTYVASAGMNYNTLPNSIEITDAALSWTLTGNADGFTLTGDDSVLYNSSNSLYFKAGTAATWTATAGDGYTFQIKSGTRYLGLRDDIATVDANGNPLFRCNSSASTSSYSFYLYSKNEVAAPCTHSNTTTTTTPATCTAAGKTVETCDDCGKTISSSTIPATGHVNTTTTTTAATCTADGKTVETCDDCGKTVNTTTIPATGHNYVGGTCTNCGESDGSSTEPEVPSFELTDGKYVIAAKVDGVYYAMSTDFAAKIAGTEINVVDGRISAEDAEGYIITLTASGDGWTISNDGNYLKYASSTNLGSSSDPYVWTISEGIKGSFRVTSETEGRGLVYRTSTYNQFGGYLLSSVTATNTQYYDVEFIPVDGVVSDEPTDSSLVFYRNTLNLQSYIGVNYMVRNSDAADYDSFYVTVTVGDGEVQTPAANAMGSSYTYYEIRTAAPQMTETLVATLYGVKDGKTYRGETLTWSVRDGVMEQINAITDLSNETNLKKMTLMVDMLNYGAAAQNRFNNRTDDLANSKLTAAQKAYGTSAIPAMNETITETSTGSTAVTFYSKSLALQSSIEMQFMLKTPGYAYTDLEARITYNGKTVVKELGAYINGYAMLVFDGLACADLRTPVQITIYDKSTAKPVSATLNCTVAALANTMVNSQADLIYAMMRYGDSAKAYYG